jgi:hypothetical protein
MSKTEKNWYFEGLHLPPTNTPPTPDAEPLDKDSMIETFIKMEKSFGVGADWYVGDGTKPPTTIKPEDSDELPANKDELIETYIELIQELMDEADEANTKHLCCFIAEEVAKEAEDGDVYIAGLMSSAQQKKDKADSDSNLKKLMEGFGVTEEGTLDAALADAIADLDAAEKSIIAMLDTFDNGGKEVE